MLCSLLMLVSRRNVHTGETNEISTSTRERKMFLFLVLVLVLISCMITLGFSCACAYAYAFLYIISSLLEEYVGISLDFYLFDRCKRVLYQLSRVGRMDSREGVL